MEIPSTAAVQAGSAGLMACMDPKDSTAWLDHFERNRLRRPEPDWHRPTPFPGHVTAPLARSLAHFQLGESGEGTTLLTEARRTWADDPDYVAALKLFVAEEQEHARLLEHLVARYGGTLVTSHWTHRCFQTLRRALGVGFEIQMLLIAEIIGTAYYRLLRSTGDTVLRQVCELMLRDETAHLRFHADRLAVGQLRWSGARRALWTAQFQLLFRAAVTAAWVDHRRALRALGINRRLFSTDVRAEARAWLLRRSALGRSPGPSDGQAGGVIPSSPNKNA
ncbi:MAG TPA: ferritin-like domain-containing protein [Acidimicrobiia bacterium]|nr:ferritin-like domain-containing protein [Acidimicrobiia bacterium]